MDKLSKCFSNVISKLATQYQELLKQTAKHYPFRIVAKQRFPRTGETIFTVQFVGKSTCVKLNATELAKDDDLIQGFSPRDVKQIMEAALIKQKLSVIEGGLQEAPYKVIAKNFQRKDTKPSYVIQQKSNDQQTTKILQLDDFVNSKEMLLKFSKKDIYEIAYTAGANSITTAQDEIERDKR